MGRHLNYPTRDGSVVRETGVGSGAGKKPPSETVLRRLGFGKQICMSCNARNPADADHCRKCGKDELRTKKHDYRSENASNNS